MWVIVYGGLLEGVQGVVGPFPTEAEAQAYAESHNLGHPDSKVVVELEPPR